MTHGVWTINQIWSFTPKTLLFLKKNCRPIDEQWEESSPFGWYIVIHQPEIKEIFGWFPFATNVMTSWWGHCNLNHDQWTEKDMGWYVALSTMWYSKPQIDRKMATRKLSGKHHRTNILHVFQRIGIIVIDVATTYNSNCTPSKISRKSELGNPKLMKSPGCSDEGPTQPGHPVLSKGASKATAADDQIRWALTKFETRWVYLKMDYPRISQIYSPLAILLAFSDPGVLQASNFICLRTQDLSEKSSTRISSVCLILCHEGCLLIRKNPSILLRMCLIFNGRYDSVEYEKYAS